MLEKNNSNKPKRPRGRPKGSTQYEEPKEMQGHFMTPTAHRWIRAHKEKIEEEARR